MRDGSGAYPYSGFPVSFGFRNANGRRACDSFQKLSKIRDQCNAPSDCEDENPRFGPNPLHSLRFAIRSQQVQRLFIPTLERLIRARLSSLRPFCCWSGADPLTRRFARP